MRFTRSSPKDSPNEITIGITLKDGSYVGHITFYIHTTYATIMFMNVTQSHRGKHISYKLMIIACKILALRSIYTIELDDCSDLFGTNLCIYDKLGFLPANSPDEPERVGHTLKVLKFAEQLM